MDAHEAKANEEDWTFDRTDHIAKWKKQGWPGLLSSDNSRILHVARLWFAYDSVELAQQISGLVLPASRAEGIVMRLGMAFRYWRQRADEERQRER